MKTIKIICIRHGQSLGNVEAVEHECLDALTNDFIELGFTLETKNYEETKSCQRRN